MRKPFATAIVLTALCILRPAPALAQIEEVIIQIDGITCNLCAAGIERSLRRVDGVSSVTIAMQDGAAAVRLKPGAAFDAEKLRAAVKSAGHTARTFEFRVRGSVRHQDGRYLLQPAGESSPLPVRAASSTMLEPFVGQVVRARAVIQATARSPLEIELTEVVASR
jgi:copper chaperone CopZ